MMVKQYNLYIAVIILKCILPVSFSDILNSTNERRKIILNNIADAVLKMN